MLPPLTVIFLWPLVMMGFFKRFPLAIALCVSIVAGHLLLPTSVGYNLPLLPTINKTSMPSLAAVLILMVILGNLKNMHRGTQSASMDLILPGWLPRNPVAILLISGIVIGAFMTIVTNGDPLRYGATVLPSLKPYDGFSAVLTAFIVLLPFLLGRKFLASAEGHRILLFILCMAGLLYSIPTLYEVRMSPRLNVAVYGFFPNSWSQHIRNGGYRPLVFLKHGLWLGIFLSGTVLAVLGYSRIVKREQRGLYLLAGAWLFMTLVLAKSLGALLITLVLIPVVLLFTVRLQLIVAAVIAATVLFYPALRGGGIIPTDPVVTLANRIDPIRALSLQYRLGNEDILLSKANERPLFGWGPRGRARVYDDRGNDISTTDGSWIISIGSQGWIGYISRFGLLTIPVILLSLRKRKYEVTLPTSILCLVLVGNLIDLIPNSGLTPVTWLMAGALMGYLETPGTKSQEQQTIEPDITDRDTSPYRRGVAHSPKQGPDLAQQGPLDTPQKATHRYSRFAPQDSSSDTNET